MNAKHFSFLSITDVLKGFPATREKKGHFLAYLLYVKIIKKNVNNKKTKQIKWNVLI